jgi:hypothetical protein
VEDNKVVVLEDSRAAMVDGRVAVDGEEEAVAVVDGKEEAVAVVDGKEEEVVVDDGKEEVAVVDGREDSEVSKKCSVEQ